MWVFSFVLFFSSWLIIICVFLPTLQSQVYRSQPDLVSAVYDTTASTLAVDYYGQYPNQTDASQNYYLYPPDYTADSTWIAPEQRNLNP